MGFLDTLRGSGTKDGMRQTTSLTMAYLLEQNARFEAFMRQRVEELETIVTQQQARVSMGQEETQPANGEETWPEEDDWSQEDGWSEAEEETTVTAGDFGAAETTSAFAFSSATEDETRPAPAMPVVGQFVLDDVVGADEPDSRAPAGGVTSPAEEATPAASLEPDTGSPEGEADEPVEPPDWQAMLLGNSGEETYEAAAEPDAETGPVELEATPAGEAVDPEGIQMDEPDEEQTVTLVTETAPVEPEATSAGEAVDPEGIQMDEPAEGSNSSDFVPDWLRRQQQELLAPETESTTEALQSPTSEKSSESGQQGARKEQPDGHPVSSSSLAEKVKAAREEQAVLPAEVVGDDEAWDTSLEQTGPVEEWA
jgi:hypothetical protein